MTRLARLATPAWIAGLSLAATGVAAARGVTPALAPAWQPVVRLAGELLALIGLLVIAFGISRRVHRSSAP